MMHPTLSAGVLGAVLVMGAAGGRPATVSAPAVPAPVLAGPTISDMDVEIWPEYDDPRVLVIYEGRLTPATKLPADISFVIPDGAQINMAGGIDANGQHIHATYQTRKRADGMVEISYQLGVPVFHMEFYYDAFKGGEQRNFTYGVYSPFAADTLVVRVQEPRRATDFKVSPLTREMTQDNDGFTYSVLRYDTVRAGAQLPISVSYAKTDSKPSAAPKKPAPEAAGPASPFQRHRTAIYLLALVALISVGVGLYPHVRDRWAGMRSHRSPDGPRPRRGAAGPGSAPRFCTECGEPLANGARYCGMCGAPVQPAASRHVAGSDG